MDRTVATSHLDYTLSSTSYHFPGVFYQGKVRDTYKIDQYLILVASDRISAFDHILRQTIPFKGQVLNKLASYFFEATQDIIPNHIIEIPDPNVTIAKACSPIPIEFVVRGYLAGHAWRLYNSGLREICGTKLPEGLRQNSRLPAPILTPATKATEGHDEDISKQEIIEGGILDRKLFEYLEDAALKLFERGTQMAKEKGLILVDTKYEFGLDASDVPTVIDEIHTPDSSRYFYSDTYEGLLAENKPQRQLSKEFVREWLMQNNFQGLEGQVLPDLPDEFREEISLRYIELYEQLTGHLFTPDLNQNPVARIESAIRTSKSLGHVLI